MNILDKLEMVLLGNHLDILDELVEERKFFLIEVTEFIDRDKIDEVVNLIVQSEAEGIVKLYQKDPRVLNKITKPLIIEAYCTVLEDHIHADIIEVDRDVSVQQVFVNRYKADPLEIIINSGETFNYTVLTDYKQSDDTKRLVQEYQALMIHIKEMEK